MASSLKEQPATGGQAFISDLTALRARAKDQIMKGAVTPSYPEADRQAIIELLNTALATEIVCVLRYKRHYYATHGIRAKFVSAEFLEHANEEQAHADQIAERIVQLGEDPDLNPATLLTRSHSEYDEETSLRAMLEADLVAERIAIESYREMVTFIGAKDPTTRRLMESILAQEEEHAEDLVDLLEDLPKD
ncbi:MAG TPA: ferritin-like domain-containing protein [Steroidobacteraceae bacterium]|nr:ferritin-like domain-containing protein [Steroidobacteraceae bacterium]